MSDRRRKLRTTFAPDRTLAASYLCVFLYSSGEAALHVLVPPYLAAGLGYGPAVIGGLLAVFALSSLALRLPVGASYSAARVRPLLLAGGLLSAGAFALVPLTHSVVLFGALMAMDGVGWAMATTTQLTVLVSSRPAHRSLASVMGWYSGFTGLGHAVGGAGAGVLADSLGFTAGFLLLACLPALATAVMLRSLPAQLAAARAQRSAGTGPDPEPEPAGPRSQRQTSARRRGHVVTVRALASLPLAVYSGAIIMFFINVQSALFSTFHPVLALAAGLSLTQIGLLAGSRSLASSVTRMGLGVLLARSNGSWLTSPMFLLGVATLFFLPIVRQSFWLQMVLFVLAGLSRGVLRVTGASTAFAGAEEREREQGLVSALLHMGLDLGKVAGPALGGLVAEVAGVPAMFQICAVVLVVVYGPFWLATMRPQRRPGPAPA